MPIMTVDDKRIMAHTTVLSQASSPCGRYVVFGTNTQRLFVYSTSSLFQHSQFESKPVQTLHLNISKSWHSMCSSGQFLFCASHDVIWIIRWTCKGNLILETVDQIRLPSPELSLYCPVITNVLYDLPSDRLLVTTGIGNTHIYSLADDFSHQTCFTAHNSLIHGLCLAGESQFATCSEEGSVRFWDLRTVSQRSSSKPVASYCPYRVAGLARPHLGNWLTTVSCDTSDWNWFVTGGGPCLSLWNRRAGRHISPLNPDSSKDTWYAQTSVFSFPEHEPRIVAGGNSGHIYRWDHGGSLMSSLSLTDPPGLQLSHVMVVKPITAGLSLEDVANFSTEDEEGMENHRSAVTFGRRPFDVLVVGGAGPVIRVISALGYPLGTLSLL